MTAATRADAVRAGAVTALALAGCLALAVLVPPQAAAPGILVLAASVAFRHQLASQRGLLALVLLTVMWIPAGRYSVLGVPPALPWRLVALGLLLGLFLSLALDRRVGWRPTPFLRPVLLVAAVGLLSVLVNVRRLALLGRVDDGALAVVQTALLLSLFVTVRQLMTSARLVDWAARVLVLAGGVVGLGAGVERATGFNAFISLQAFLPLQLLSEAPTVSRYGTARALGSSNHPIALSVVMVVLVPLAVFLARRSPWPSRQGLRQALYLGAAFAMVTGAFLTGSRTFVVVIAVMALVLLLVDVLRFTRVVLAAVPLALLAAVLIPGAVRGVLDSFSSPSSLIDSQYAAAGGRGSGRLADVAPSLAQAQQHPLLGTGVGSRLISGPDANAFILDNQYLSTLLESGFLGLLAVLVMLVLPAVAMVRAVRDPWLSPGERDLVLALGCAFTGYAVAVALFDAFAFQQTLMVFCVLLAMASHLVTVSRERTDGSPGGLAAAPPAGRPDREETGVR